MKYYFVAVLFLFMSATIAQNKSPYAVFSKNGKKLSYEKLLEAAQKSDVVLFGELHDNSVIHWLQLEFLKDMHSKKGLVLGAEMIEADNQKQLNQYLKNEITSERLDSTARMWPNFKTDYKPLVDFAKDKKIDFIATNVPRRYARMVYKKGFEALEQLSPEEKSWMSPLPIPYDSKLPGYAKMVTEMGGHGGDNLPKAQAIKDATMAYFILENRKENALFIHFNGTYHSENFEGIYWYLKKEQNNLKIMTIATVAQDDINKLEKENQQLADFILVIDEDVTKTY